MKITKELVVAVLGLILGIVNGLVGQEIFNTEEQAQIAEIVFLIVTFVAAYLHKRDNKTNQQG